MALQKKGAVTTMPLYIVCRDVPVATHATAALSCFIRILQSYRFSTSFLKVTVYFKHVIMPASFFLYVVSLPEKAMAPHSSTPAWKIPWTEEPGGLQSMELQRVGND